MMPTETPKRTWFPSDSILFLIAFAALFVHLAANVFEGYGYFRDELYYLACSHHLGWGYVDQPPLSIILLFISRIVFGESLVGLRFLPAVAGGATVYLTGLMARELGGKRSAEVLAAVAALVSPIYLGMTGYYSMNSYDILVWALSAYLLIRLVRTQDSRYWIWLGVTLGFGLLNKIDVLWLGFGIAVGLLVTPERKWLKTRWPWLAGMIAFILFLPYIIWNITHDFAHVEFIRNATSGKYSGLTPLSFIADQFLANNPFSIPLWIAGLWFFLVSNRGTGSSLPGWIYVAAFTVLLANGHSKGEYLSPAYAMLFAGGSVLIESWILNRALRWPKPVMIGVLLLSGILFAPLAVPILPVETYINYSKALGIAPSTSEHKALGELPQHYADMFGWAELATTVSGIYDDLTPSEKSRCVVYTQNYGEAGAIDFYRKYVDLPRVVSGHNSYFLWGPGPEKDSAVVIVVGGRMEDHLKSFERVEIAGSTNCNYCMPYENHLPIYICRNLKRPLAEIWPSTKNYS